MTGIGGGETTDPFVGILCQKKATSYRASESNYPALKRKRYRVSDCVLGSGA